jgi:hypothetical protein
MTLTELERHEQVILLALLGLMARIDLQTSPAEEELLQRVVSELGLVDPASVIDEAAQLQGVDAILRAAGKVVRPEAREVMFELLYDMAIKETIVENEGKLLDRIAFLWNLPMRASARP